mmetsp:Transcript_82930/g.165542  ORF Transcript_82930/g.165542 Transcript_82930/m.165542 type:complete len:256 (+) Transcript_82930:821-1588(+)
MALQLPYLFHGPGALRIVRVEPQRFLQMLLGLIEVRAVEESHRAQDVCLGHVGVALDHLAGGAERSITKTEPQFGSHQPEARDGSVRLGEHVGEEGASEGVISMVDGSLTLLLPGRKLRNLGLFLDHLRVTRLPRTRVGSHHGLLKLAKLAESACEALVGLRTRRIELQRGLAVGHTIIIASAHIVRRGSIAIIGGHVATHLDRLRVQHDRVWVDALFKFRVACYLESFGILPRSCARARRHRRLATRTIRRLAL